MSWKDIPLPPGFSRGLTVGAIEIGNDVGLFLMGIVAAQVFSYYRQFSRDPFYIRLGVAFVFVFDLVHTVLLSKVIYFYTIVGPCDPLALDHIDRNLSISIPFLGLVALIVQTMYCLRVLRITESTILALGCWSLALARFSMHLYSTYLAFVAKSLHTAITWKRFHGGLLASLACGTAADIAICVCITVGLWSRKTGFERTDKLVDKVIAWTIGTGFLPTVIGIVEIITYEIMPKNFIWMGLWWTMSKFLSISLMTSLHQRTAYSKNGTDFSMALGASSGGTSNFATGLRFPVDKSHEVSGIRMELSTVTKSELRDPERDSFHYKPEGVMSIGYEDESRIGAAV
ncbi:hypothetical protein BKA62DRAFT_192445 [Auriculariales sp. MPI-PUGE-AT-0066]|nr:hypothetical protein BKA62DRAFT_192445 [Auriculariales sp. MPI-PUGE-AT-0066]